MRYVFLMIGILAASILWGQKAIEKHEIRYQLAQVPGYSIIPD